MIFKRKLLIIGIMMLLVVLTLSSCMKKALNISDNNEVKLKWVLLSPGKQIDQQRVWDEFNKKLEKAMPNTKVDFIGITPADYQQKWSLMCASNENVDIAWTGYLMNYEQEIRNGNYMELDDLLLKNAEELKKSLPDWVWDTTKVEGKIYAVPNFQMIAGGLYGLRTPKKLADKFLDVKKAQEVFLRNKTFNAECYDVIEEYLAELLKNNELQKGMSSYFPAVDLKGYDVIAQDLVIKQDDKNFNVMYKFETPEAKLNFQKMASWFNKGYIRKDVLSVNNAMDDDGKENGHVVWMTTVFNNQAQLDSKQFGYPIDVIPISDYYFMNGYTKPATATAIARTSQNPQSAIKLIELLNTSKGKELYNELVYGIEGEHYKKINDKRINTLSFNGTPNANSKYGIDKWVLGNTFNAYETQTDPEGYNDFIKNNVNEQSVKSQLSGFKPNTDALAVEYSQIASIKKEFLKSLTSGALGDKWEETFNKYMEKLKNAGIDKIKAEIQNQVDDYAKKKGLR